MGVYGVYGVRGVKGVCGACAVSLGVSWPPFNSSYKVIVDTGSCNGGGDDNDDESEIGAPGSSLLSVLCNS